MVHNAGKVLSHMINVYPDISPTVDWALNTNHQRKEVQQHTKTTATTPLPPKRQTKTLPIEITHTHTHTQKTTPLSFSIKTLLPPTKPPNYHFVISNPLPGKTRAPGLDVKPRALMTSTSK